MLNNFDEVFAKIENARAELKKNESEIEIIDYGAGKPNSTRSEEEMKNGVKTKTKICDLAKIGVKESKAKDIYKILGKIIENKKADSIESSNTPKIKILELGTCVGFSSAYFALFAPSAEIITIEGDPQIAAIARKNHKNLGVENQVHVECGRFDLVLPEILKDNKFDLAFIDGHHDKAATLAYFSQIEPHISENGAILFDDISWSDGMKEAWALIFSIANNKEIESSKNSALKNLQIARKLKAENLDLMGLLWLNKKI